MNIKRFIATVALILGVSILSGCYHTSTQENVLLKSRVTAWCDQDKGVDVFVTNKDGGAMPTSVVLEYPTYEYDTPSRVIPEGTSTVWSFPGSRPTSVVVRVAGVGMTQHSIDYGICSVS